MDISLKKGDIVAVIKQQDPMGNKMRWFVDRGGNNIYLLKYNLKYIFMILVLFPDKPLFFTFSMY